jgi:DNA-binding MarR family transcriptional regulator
MTGPKSPSDFDFDLEQFLPYLLNQAAEATSRGFQAIYRDHFGMTRTQWRVLANLGKFGAMTATDICTISHIEKTKVSRAIAALEAGTVLTRTTSDQDRRVEILALTEKGRALFIEMGQLAKTYDARLRALLGPDQSSRLDGLLHLLKQPFPTASDDIAAPDCK